MPSATGKKSRLARTLPVARRAPSAGHLGPQPFFLRVITSRDVTVVDRLVEVGNALPIGRAVEPAEGVVVDDPTLSRRRALFEEADGELTVRDTDSANGVLVGGVRVPHAHVYAGDIVRLGDTVLLVERGARARGTDGHNMGLVGRSPAIERVRATVRKVAPSLLSVVVTGPTGTGKEVVAQALHATSERAGDFIAVNCPALPGTLVESTLFGHRKGAFTHATSDQPGAFMQADGGTLFLDEIGDMPVELQPKLLRALESGEVTPVGAARGRKIDVRVVVATNVELARALFEGTFRQDLYARLAGVRIDLPPLAERKDDIPMLLAHFLPAELRAVPMTADFAERLMLWHWPRNVREVRKLAERLAVLHADASAWEVDMLDEEMFAAPGLPAGDATGAVGVAGDDAARERPSAQPSAQSEGSPGRPDRGPPPSHEELLALLDRFDGNVTELARHVGRSRKQVYRWMAAHGVSR